MILNNALICYDYESISSNPDTTEPCEIAAKIINPRTLKVVEGGEFTSLMKPTDFSLVEEKALEVNHITRAELESAPEQETVFKDFVRFCQKFNVSGRKPWCCPIPCGHNIMNFDQKITARLCERYKTGPIFHPLHFIDTMNLHFLWFENCTEPEKYNMDYLRPWWGMSSENAHRAMADVDKCSDWIIRFLTFHRRINEKNKPKFKGAFSNDG